MPAASWSTPEVMAVVREMGWEWGPSGGEGIQAGATRHKSEPWSWGEVGEACC